MHWNLNYITEVWYKNNYTLKNSIHRYGLHEEYKYSSSNISFKVCCFTN